MLNPYKRYQVGLHMEFLFPTRKDGRCSCGCSKKIEGRRKKWHNDDCRRNALNQFHIIKGDTEVIRAQLFQLEQGYCRNCGVYSENWEADHITPVRQGGGACGLDNFQTLCADCHKEKTFGSNRIPDSSNIHTSSLNIIPSSFDCSGTFHKGVSVDIVR